MTGLFSFSSDFSELAGLSGPKHPKSLSLSVSQLESLSRYFM